MADEPENVDLRFLAEQGKRILAELSEARTEREELRAEQHALASLLGKVSDAVTSIASTQAHHGEVLARHSAILEHHSAILEHHSGLLERLADTQANQGARLNAIDGRLALIERHTGMVKA